MAITEIPEVKPGAPTNLTETADSSVGNPTNTTEVAEVTPGNPLNTTEIADGVVTAPTNLSETAEVTPGNPLNTTEIAVSEPGAPTSIVGTLENKFIYSEQFDNAAWTKVSTTILADQTIAPDGSLTADLVQGLEASSNITQTISAIVQNLTFSLFVKSSGAATTARFRWQNNGGSQVLDTFDIPTEWTRVSITRQASGTGVTQFGVQGNTAGDTVDFYVWGGQLNEGELAPYIQTTTSPLIAGELNAPSNLTEIGNNMAGNPTNLTEVADAGINRTLKTLFNFNADLGLPDSVTYSRSSSATYVEEYRGPLGRFQKRLTNDYVGSVTNLLTYSEQFDNAIWTKTAVTVTSNAETAPDGTKTAEKMTEDEANSVHRLGFIPASTTDTTYNFSVYLKAGTRSLVLVTIGGTAMTGPGGSGADKLAIFDLKNGVITKGENLATLTYVGDGWYRCSCTGTTDSDGGSFFPSIYIVNSGTTVSYTGNGTGSLYLWGAQLTTSVKPLPYVKTLDTEETQVFTANPRYEEKGLLVEGASTNLVLNSQDITSAGGWSENQVTLLGNNILAPDGSFTGSKMTETAVENLHRTFTSSSTISSGVTAAFSCYAKVGSRNRVQIPASVTGATSVGNTIFNLATGEFITQQTGDTAELITDGWYRISKQYTTNATTVTPQVLILDGANNASYLGNTGNFLYLWGAQLEALPFATSYIRTEGSAVSRAAESILISSPAYLPKQDESQTVHVEFNFNSSGVLANRYLFRTSESNNAIEISSANKLNYFMGSSVIAGASSPNTINDLKSITVQLNKSTNQILKYEDKNLIATATYIAGSGSLTSAGIGMSFDSTKAIYGHISKLEVYDLALTANEVKAL